VEVNNEIKALIYLLEDPDIKVYNAVKEKIASYGADIIPELENAWEDFSFGVLFQTRIENIIHHIQFQDTKTGLLQWKEGVTSDLLTGLFIIAGYQYPDIEKEKYVLVIDALVKEVWIELNDSLTIFEKINVLNRVFFEFNAFKGNTTNFHSPQNSFINDVLDTKRGNPVLLSCLYLIIANKVGILLKGVNLPRHFILMLSEHQAKGSFYINPFNKGGLLSKRDIDHFLKQLKVASNPIYFTACNNQDIIKRVLNNLHHSYVKMGVEDKANEMQVLLSLF